MSFSSSSLYGVPAFSQSFGYMLMDVKPGSVLISFKMTLCSF